MQIYANRFAYGTVRRCVIKVGRWYADACEWISKSSQPPQFEIYVEWCGDGSALGTRIVSVFRMHAVGDFIVVYRI